ncbi:DUF4915 domain-containing protein [Priestia megaterium]
MTGCTLIVTCCLKNGGIYKLDLKENGYKLKKALENEDCRGITKYKDNYIMVSKKEIYFLDKELNILKKKNMQKDLDFHGCTVLKNEIYIVETSRNAIGIYDLLTLERIDEINLFSEDIDTHHINDLCVDGKKMYISMFSLTENWRNNCFANNGVIVEYCLIERRIKDIPFKNLIMPHSVVMNDKSLYYCNSWVFEVFKNHDVIFKTNDFCRGLAFYKENMFIGQSINRKNNGKRCGIYLINDSKKTSKFIDLPSQEVYAILVV